MFFLMTGILLTASCLHDSAVVGSDDSFDLVIYGGTSGGIAAAVQAKRMGLTVVVVEPTQRIGGLTTGGLGQTDIGRKSAIGGIAREFYVDVAKYYQRPQAWVWQRPEEYRGGGQSATDEGEAAQWTFEPHAALDVFQAWVARQGIRVDYGRRLDRDALLMTGGRPARILGIRTESGDVYRGRVFIDATYEGDLMATAGVSYTVGREANATYGETLNGVQARHATHHQFQPGVDPYVEPGNPASGLLPGIDPHGPGEEGAADSRVQAYCFRMCLTDHPENRIPFHKPEGYQPLRYELLLRNFEAGETSIPWINSAMPNRKTDTNNRTGFSTDFIGQNYAYPEASYAERERIVARHRRYQQGLMWTLANHPRVPESIRREVARWGVCRDEFQEGDGWQQQLYIREARRLVGEYVMTQHNCQGREVVADPIGLAAYTMDSHHQQRYVTDAGHVRNEGDVQVGGFPPYGISYRALLPQRDEVSNLLVPVCLSASHIAFGSIRMEPVFMITGQSAATAAALAIDNDCALHDVPYQQLADRLLADRQILHDAQRDDTSGIPKSSLNGLVVDNTEATLTGPWQLGHATHPRIGPSYMHDNNQAKGQCRAVYEPSLPAAGRYTITLYWPPHANRATNTRVTIQTADAEHSLQVDQRDPASNGKRQLGEYYCEDRVQVIISNADTDGHVIADAVQFQKAER